MNHILCFNIKVGKSIYPENLDLYVRLNPTGSANQNRHVIRLAIQRAIQKRVTDFSFKYVL
jgi:hypothetical protein